MNNPLDDLMVQVQGHTESTVDCSGMNSDSTIRPWYVPNDGGVDLETICEKCFLELAAKNPTYNEDYHRWISEDSECDIYCDGYLHRTKIASEYFFVTFWEIGKTINCVNNKINDGIYNSMFSREFAGQGSGIDRCAFINTR